MTNMFGGLTTDGLEEAEDRLGGFTLFESDIYTGTVKALYATQSSAAGSKSQGLVLNLEINGKEYRETLWVTDKAGQNFYVRNEKKIGLPGFQTADDLCYAVTGHPLSAQTFEDKVINVYNTEQKKELPTNVKMLMAAVGQEVSVGIVKQLVNRQVRDQQTGEYADTAESREENVINKVFHTPTKMTIAEVKAKKTEPEFWDAWLKKNKGNTQDRRKIKDGSSNGQNGRSGPPQSGGAAKGNSTSSLFNT